MPFERGHLVWLKDIEGFGSTSQVIAIFGGQNAGDSGSWLIELEKWNGQDGICPVPAPPRNDLYLPDRNLAQVWCKINGLETLGYATDQEREFRQDTVSLQHFDNVILLKDSDGHNRNLVYVLSRNNGSYARVRY